MRNIPIVSFCLFIILVSCSAEKFNSKQDTKMSPAGNNAIYLIVGDVKGSSLNWKAQNQREIRGKLVNINPRVFETDSLKEGRKIIFNLFEDLILFARIDSARGEYTGTDNYTGEILSFDKENFSMIVKDKRILVSIKNREDRKAFMIYHSKRFKNHVVVELDMKKFDPIQGDSTLYPDSVRHK